MVVLELFVNICETNMILNSLFQCIQGVNDESLGLLMRIKISFFLDNIILLRQKELLPLAFAFC